MFLNNYISKVSDDMCRSTPDAMASVEVFISLELDALIRARGSRQIAFVEQEGQRHLEGFGDLDRVKYKIGVAVQHAHDRHDCIAGNDRVGIEVADYRDVLGRNT